MKRLARVIKSDPSSGTARVTIYRHRKCTGCGDCECAEHPTSDVPAENLIKAEIDQYVTVDARRRFSPAAFLVMAVLPVLLFFGGLYLGMRLFPGESGGYRAVAIAFVGLAGALLAARHFRRSYRPKWTARITGICSGPDSANTYKTHAR